MSYYGTFAKVAFPITAVAAIAALPLGVAMSSPAVVASPQVHTVTVQAADASSSVKGCGSLWAIPNVSKVISCDQARAGKATSGLLGVTIAYNPTCVAATEVTGQNGKMVRPYRVVPGTSNTRIMENQPLPVYNLGDVAHCGTLKPTPEECAQLATAYPVSPDPRGYVVLKALGCTPPKRLTVFSSLS